jgi:hypothetical protein
MHFVFLLGELIILSSLCTVLHQIQLVLCKLYLKDVQQ